MERGFVGLDVAVLAVGDALAIADEPPAQLVVDRLTQVGHRVIHQAVAGDNVQQVKAKYLEWIADPLVDVVIVTSGVRSEAASEALSPLATKSLLGFADLFRHLTYAEIGTAAMLVDAAAAQCKSTFIFVLPASIGAVRTALDKLLLPQLDYRTKPHNLVMRMSRHHVGAPTNPIIEQTAPVKTPWITAKPGGTTLPPSLPKAPAPKRAATEPGAPSVSAAQSVSQRIELAAVLPREQVSVSQRMAAVLDTAAARTRPPTNQPLPSPSSIPIPSGLPADGGAGFQTKEPTAQGVPPPPARPATVPPPLSVAVPSTIRPPTQPPPLRSKTPTTVAAVPLKPPAAAIPLSALLTNSSGPVTEAEPDESSINGGHSNGTNGHAHPLGGVALDALTRSATTSGPIRVTADRLSSDREDLSDEESREAAADRAALARTTAAINAALDDADDRVTPPVDDIDDATDQLEDLPVSSPAIAVPPVDAAPPKRPSAPAVPDAARRPSGTIPAVPPPTPRRTGAMPLVQAAAAEGDTIAASARDSISAQKRAVTARVAAVDYDDDDLDEQPRRIAIPSRRRQRRQLLVVWSVITLAALSLVALVFVYLQRQRTQQRGYAQPEPPPVAQQTPTQPPTEEPAVPVDAAPALVEPTTPPVEPTEIDIPPPEVTPPPARPTTAPTTRPATTPATRPTTPTTRPVTIPTTRPTTPTTKPEKPEKPEAAAEAGCDEVSCVLDGYKLACCTRFKPKTAGVAETPDTSSLSKKQITAGVSRVKPAIIKCGEQNKVKGTVRVSATVAPSGAVKNAVVTDSPDPYLAACVADVIKKAQFDATDEGGSFTYPFVF